MLWKKWTKKLTCMKQKKELLTYNYFHFLAVFVLPVIEYMTPVCSLMSHIHVSYLCKHHYNHPDRLPKNTCLRYLSLAPKTYSQERVKN